MTKIITLIDVVNRIKELSTELENKSISYCKSRRILSRLDRLYKLGKYMIENPNLIVGESDPYIPTKESLELLRKNRIMMMRG